MKALVCGGGIGGLVTAIALQQHDIDVTVLERSPELRPLGAGITIWINAMKALRKLGLGNQIAEAGQPALDGDVDTWRGRKLTRSLARDLVSRYGEMVVALHRADLQRILLEAVGEGTVRLAAEATGFEQDSDGVTVRLADGSEERGDVLVGADGLWSSTRMILHAESRPRYAGYTAWRGVLPYPADRAGFESWGQGRRFGFVPIGHGKAYWFATANAPEGTADSGSIGSDLLERFRDWHEPIPAVIAQTPETAILRNDIYDLEPLKQWGRGRVTLLGDAAHAMTPNLGQGACQAIEDAVVLAGRVAQEPDPVTALRSYEAARIPRTSALIQQSRRLGQIGQIENPAGVWLRDTLVSVLPARLQLRQLEPVVGYEV